MWYPSVVLSLLVISSRGLEVEFPPGFEFGVASSAYQVEGAWNISGKTMSILDGLTHYHGYMIADGATGDVACDSYHQWQRDVDMLAELGVDFYRFSISWTRLLPTGVPNKISYDGVKYYNNLINGLLQKGVKPLVTIHHFDMPQNLQDLGGWMNPLSADWFADYARVVYQLFGDRVETWITINEPIMLCNLINSMTEPGSVPMDVEVAPYLCSKHVLMGHAKAWRVYDEEFRAKYNGKVSLTNLIFWMDPYSPNDEKDHELTEIAKQFGGGMFSHPVYSKEGGWPPLVEKLMAEKSKQEGYEVSRLPLFTEEEKELVRGTHDFYGLNYYTGRRVRSTRPGERVGIWPLEGLHEFDMVLDGRSLDTQSQIGWFYNYPEGLRKTLNWIKEQYGDLEIAILENGYPHTGQRLKDADRISWLEQHLEQVLLAIKEDGVRVFKYTIWSLMDSFEMVAGYFPKFGLYEVDFSNPLRPRTPRQSARAYTDVIKARSMTSCNNGKLCIKTTAFDSKNYNI